MPTLLSVIPAPTFGGAANHCVRLREPFERAGWRLVAVLPSEPGNAAPRLRDAGVQVVQTPMHRLRATRDLRSHGALAATFVPEVRALARLAREHDADVVQNHGDLNPHAAIAGRIAGRAVVFHIQDTRTPPALRRVTMPLVCALADAFTTIGWELGRAHPGVLGFGDRHVTVYPPVDAVTFRPDPARRAAARAELGIAPDAVAVGTVGNRNPQKGLDWFVRAAALAQPRVPGLVARVLGAPSPGHEAYEAGARDEAARAGLGAPQLGFVDPGARVAELMPALDVLVIASVPRSEGIPTVALEAMACGIPVVTTDVGAVREVVRDGVGIVVAPLDAPALAEAIVAVAADPARRAEMGRLGRERIEREHGVEACAEGHLRAYDLALTHAAGRRRR